MTETRSGMTGVEVRPGLDSGLTSAWPGPDLPRSDPRLGPASGLASTQARPNTQLIGN